MTHALVALAGDKLAPLASFAGSPVLVCGAVLVGYACVLLAVATVMYLFVERPARNWIRRAIGVTRAPVVGAG